MTVRGVVAAAVVAACAWWLVCTPAPRTVGEGTPVTEADPASLDRPGKQGEGRATSEDAGAEAAHAGDADVDEQVPGRAASPEEDALGSVPPMAAVAALMGEGVTVRASELPLYEEASAVLERARDAQPCVLVDSGYLDLLGNVWSCTVQGDGWVEVTVVREREQGKGSDVTTVRMDADAWARELEGVMRDGE